MTLVEVLASLEKKKKTKKDNEMEVFNLVVFSVRKSILSNHHRMYAPF